jgi:hypothetical protein
MLTNVNENLRIGVNVRGVICYRGGGHGPSQCRKLVVGATAPAQVVDLAVEE